MILNFHTFCAKETAEISLEAIGSLSSVNNAYNATLRRRRKRRQSGSGNIQSSVYTIQRATAEILVPGAKPIHLHSTGIEVRMFMFTIFYLLLLTGINIQREFSNNSRVSLSETSWRQFLAKCSMIQANNYTFKLVPWILVSAAKQ